MNNRENSESIFVAVSVMAPCALDRPQEGMAVAQLSDRDRRSKHGYADYPP
jgi:hypothetical protein